MAMLEVHDLSTNFAKDGAKLTRWGTGEICIVIHSRAVPISCKRQDVNDMQLSSLYGAQRRDT